MPEGQFMQLAAIHDTACQFMRLRNSLRASPDTFRCHPRARCFSGDSSLRSRMTTRKTPLRRIRARLQRHLIHHLRWSPFPRWGRQLAPLRYPLEKAYIGSPSERAVERSETEREAFVCTRQASPDAFRRHPRTMPISLAVILEQSEGSRGISVK